MPTNKTHTTRIEKLEGDFEYSYQRIGELSSKLERFNIVLLSLSRRLDGLEELRDDYKLLREMDLSRIGYVEKRLSEHGKILMHERPVGFIAFLHALMYIPFTTIRR